MPPAARIASTVSASLSALRATQATLRAGAGQRQGDRLADAARGAGDDRRLAAQVDLQQRCG